METLLAATSGIAGVRQLKPLVHTGPETIDPRLPFALLLAALMPVASQAADAVSATFEQWVYPGSDLLQEGRPLKDVSAAGTGQYTTGDTFEKVVRFYAKKAGLDPTAKPLDFTLPGSAGIVGVRTDDRSPSAMLVRNVGRALHPPRLSVGLPAMRSRL